MTDLCGLKSQFDHEGVGDGNFFLFPRMGSDAGNCMLWELLLEAGVCFVSQGNMMRYTASETCFCKWGRGQEVLSKGNNNLLARTDLLGLWSAKVLHPISNPIASPCISFSQGFSRCYGGLR